MIELECEKCGTKVWAAEKNKATERLKEHGRKYHGKKNWIQHEA
jgi:ribosomal protein L33